MKIWVVSKIYNNSVLSVFSSEDKAYSEACDEILAYLMLPEGTINPFITLYDAKEYKAAFEQACNSSMNSLGVQVTSLDLDESNFVQEEG